MRRLLIGAMACLWGFRLAGHLLVRVLNERGDGRYRTLRDQWGTRNHLYMFLFFQAQAFWTVLFALPMLFASMNPDPMGACDFVGMFIWAIAVSGETLADRQLASFRTRPGNRGKVCQEGLWRYSRHPNYFFEWLHWWAYVFFGLVGAAGLADLVGPIDDDPLPVQDHRNSPDRAASPCQPRRRLPGIPENHQHLRSMASTPKQTGDRVAGHASGSGTSSTLRRQKRVEGRTSAFTPQSCRKSVDCPPPWTFPSSGRSWFSADRHHPGSHAALASPDVFPTPAFFVQAKPSTLRCVRTDDLNQDTGSMTEG